MVLDQPRAVEQVAEADDREMKRVRQVLRIMLATQMIISICEVAIIPLGSVTL